MAESKSTFTEEDGHQLAVDMLRDVRDEWFNNEEFQKCDSRTDFLLLKGVALSRYLETIITADSPALQRGFYAVLTDYIGCCMDGSIPYPERYEKATYRE